MLKKLMCLFGKHDFSKSIIRYNNLESKQCVCCGKYLNIHHGLNHAFISKESMEKDIEHMKFVLEYGDK